MKKITTFTTLAIAIWFITGCTKNTTYIIKDEPVAVTRTVSFSKDLIPIFNKNCALSGCHGAGGHVPNLAAEKAFNSLLNDPDFINVKNPEQSELYQRLTGKISPAMPMGRTSNPSNIIALVLAWIKQGAKNN